jgi:hypothetical protein
VNGTRWRKKVDLGEVVVVVAVVVDDDRRQSQCLIGERTNLVLVRVDKNAYLIFFVRSRTRSIVSCIDAKKRT